MRCANTPTNQYCGAEHLDKIKEVVDHQADMETLWSKPIDRLPTMAESALQAALRHLHAVIENQPFIAETYKKAYWEMDSEL